MDRDDGQGIDEPGDTTRSRHPFGRARLSAGLGWLLRCRQPPRPFGGAFPKDEPAEKRDFDAAMAVFRKGDFAASQLVFVDFLNRYPKTGYRQSALFWLGNAQYATRDYKDGLASFRALVAIGNDHVRLPEAVLAIANCQLELKDTKGARKTLEELLINYPSSEAAQAAKDRLARLR